WQAGSVTASTYVWSEGMADWKVVGDLKQLITLLSTSLES
ncbi:MAG: DUF4339 domain-containing protein, partial [Verrucomicrobia bacterium]|nr:DUF4339 domain-containing protein [Verrucomicrobiota bacterium]